MSEEHMSSSEYIMALPENWCWTQADKVCSSVRDGTHDTPKYVDNGIPLVTSKNLLQDGLNLTNTKMISAEDHEQISRRSAVENGDILFAMIGTVGNPVLVNTYVEFNIKNVGLFKKNPIGIMPTYFKYWLESKAFSNWLAPRLKGTTQKFAPLGLLRSLPVPLSPLDEQKRIVEKLEQLLSELDKAVEALKAAQQKLKTYRRAVLKAAVEGELSRAWREDNGAGLEPADELLRRILAERQISLTKTNQQPKPIEQNLNRLAHLPPEWRWVSCDSFIVSIRGGTSAVPENDLDGVPVLRSSSVRELSIDFDDVRFLNPSHVKTVDDLKKGDLLFTRLNGNVDYVGNCAVVSELRERVQYPDRLFCARTVNSVDSRFVAYYFASPVAKDIIRDIAKSSAGHQRIGIADIRGFAFPLPPIEEQKYLVSELDRLFSLCKHLDDTVLSKTEHVHKLRQSILQKAFSGRLVPQDPNDEPASALLERIRAEREAAGTKGKRDKKKTADEVQPQLLEVDA